MNGDTAPSNKRGDVPDNAPEHCPGTKSDEAGKASACAGCPNQQVCATAPKGPDPDMALIAQRMSTIKHKILVLSGKGGVGKSTFSTQLAYALASRGKEVGLLDIDICGPSIPKMFGLEGQEIHQSNMGWSPVYVDDNLAVMSIGFMLPNPDEAVIWRGPRKNGLIKQFLKDVNWESLDYLVVDAPPGTSDEHITIAQCLQASGPTDGAVIVTTPQEVSLIDVRKEISFCRKVGMNVIGVVENMSGLQQRVPLLNFTYQRSAESEAEDVTNKVLNALVGVFPEPERLLALVDVFPRDAGGAARMCKSMGVELLGHVPMDPAVSLAAESGQSLFEGRKDHMDDCFEEVGRRDRLEEPTSLPSLISIVNKLLSKLEK